MANYLFSKVFNSEPGWYAGDFHLHSDASNDGENPPDELAELARKEGLDFLALTDHNTIGGFSRIEENLDFLFIPGIEVTLSKGHFNVFGMGEWRPWMEDITISQKELPLPDQYQSVSDLLRLIAQEGLVSSINHPLLHPWEWQFKKTDLNFFHCVELWNDLYYPDNAQANPKTVDLWSGWLNDGVRVTAIGGSDYHYPPKPDLGLFGERLGQPTTYVYAEDLSTIGVLNGVRRGRAVVSRGPQINLQASLGAETFIIGDDIGEIDGEVEFTAKIDNLREVAHAQLVRNGQVAASEQLNVGESSLKFRSEVDRTNSSWYRLDVVDDEGQVMAITNPIFVNYKVNDESAVWSEVVIP